MDDALNLISEAVSPAAPERMWEDIFAALDAVFAEHFTPRAEKVLLSVLRFNGQLRLSEESELPHSLPPEDMMKSVAVQWLVRETGLTHLLELQRVGMTTQSPLLASVVRSAIRGAVQIKPVMVNVEALAEVRLSPGHVITIGRLGAMIGRRPEKALPRGKPGRVTKVDLEGTTKYEVPWSLQRMGVINKAVALDQQGYTYLPGGRVRDWHADQKRVFA